MLAEDFELVRNLRTGQTAADYRNGVADFLSEQIFAGPEDFDIEAWVSAAEKMYSDADFREKIKTELEADKEKLSWDYVAVKFLKGFEENGLMKR